MQIFRLCRNSGLAAACHQQGVKLDTGQSKFHCRFDIGLQRQRSVFGSDETTLSDVPDKLQIGGGTSRRGPT